MFDTDANLPWFKIPWVQIALLTLVFVALSWHWWPMGAVILCVPYAAAMSRPIMNWTADVRHFMREQTWLPVHGEHFVYRNITIHVMEDEAHWRWVCLDDVKKVVDFNPSDKALAIGYPGRYQNRGSPPRPHLRDDALIEYLGKSTNETTQRFRTWVDRSVWKPGVNVRERLGIKDDRDDGDDD